MRIIEGSQEEILAYAEWLEARQNCPKAPRQEPCTIIPKGQVFCPDEAIKQICAYCECGIDPNYFTRRHGKDFCGPRCADRFDYKPVECPTSNDLLGKEILSEPVRSSQEQSQDESCAYCKQSLDGIMAYWRNSQSFCCTRCADLYDEDLIPLDQRSKQERAHRQILAYVRDIARDKAKRPADILADLKRFYGVVLFPSELVGYLEEL